MNGRVLLTLALCGLILFVQLDAKAIKHKKHKKTHIKHKKAALPQDPPAPEGDAPAPDDAAAPPAGDAPPAGGAPPAAGADDEDDAAAPPAAAPKPGAGGAPQQPGQQPGQPPINPNDLDGNGVADNLEQPQQPLPGQPPAPGAPPPAEEEEEGSASAPQALAPTPDPYSPPQLAGGHMLPGPTPDPFEMGYNEPRYCPEPCPQECAPGCYDWCCYPSVQVPPPPMQLMMVPVNTSKPVAPPPPAPLPYPMQYGINDACSPNPCPAKKHVVASKNTTVVAPKIVVAPSPAKMVPITLQKSSSAAAVENKPSVKDTENSLEKADKDNIFDLETEPTNTIKSKEASSSVETTKKGFAAVSSDKSKSQPHVSKFVKTNEDDNNDVETTSSDDDDIV
ncbi:proline-rich proteoglycan 2-like isoform X4 [Clytia hemisphaerica]|uniref:proline-rich proteoglycan 2-like isoform X4 n=1 Tax=Clytia hemisphaerica TaxID=252671 RepID=UPI0034D5E6C3